MSFGETAATDSAVVSPTSISAITPGHAAGRVDVVVTPQNDQSHTLRGGYLYVSLTPASGPNAGGTPVTITGTGFSGVTTVSFGGVSATDAAGSGRYHNYRDYSCPCGLRSPRCRRSWPERRDHSSRLHLYAVTYDYWGSRCRFERRVQVQRNPWCRGSYHATDEPTIVMAAH